MACPSSDRGTGPATRLGGCPRSSGSSGGDPDDVLELIERDAVFVGNDVQRLTGAEHRERVFQSRTAPHEDRLPKPSFRVHHHLGNRVGGQVDQAGVAIGLAQLAQRQFPEIGVYLVTVVLAVITINQIVLGLNMFNGSIGFDGSNGKMIIPKYYKNKMF